MSSKQVRSMWDFSVEAPARWNGQPTPRQILESIVNDYNTNGLTEKFRKRFIKLVIKQTVAEGSMATLELVVIREGSSNIHCDYSKAYLTEVVVSMTYGMDMLDSVTMKAGEREWKYDINDTSVTPLESQILYCVRYRIPMILNAYYHDTRSLGQE